MFGEYDALLIADMPDAESWSAVALAVTAGGAAKSDHRANDRNAGRCGAEESQRCREDLQTGQIARFVNRSEGIRKVNTYQATVLPRAAKASASEELI